MVVKQSRPWVEKYPQIAAPVERALFELQFYRAVSPIPAIADRMPRLLAAAPECYVLVLEDLGAANDGTIFYDDATQRVRCFAMIPELVRWLAELHRANLGQAKPASFANRALRELNRDHMFRIPLQDPPALDLNAVTPGLAELAEEVRQDLRVQARCESLGRLYLAAGETLVHGDFFPGSWLLTPRGNFVIDPEFCYRGRPEFDLAILAAHLILIGGHEDPIGWVLKMYRTDATALDSSLVAQWAAVEILRRLLGVAQLPLTRSLQQKQELIHFAMKILGEA